MGVPSQHGYTSPTLPVPDPNRLIIRRTDNPRRLAMEEYGANVIDMAGQGEKTTTLLVIEDSDLTVVTACNK